MCSKSQHQWPTSQAVTMSQIMERWPWPTKSNLIKNNELQIDECHQCSKAQTSVKLILWPSNSSASSAAPAAASTPPVSDKRKTKKMWAKLPPLKQIPSSLKMPGWLGSSAQHGNHQSHTEHHGHHGHQVKTNNNNAVFRSNSFRFERPPPEDDARMYLNGRPGPVKSYSITAQDIASLNDKYEVPKDFVNHKPLKSCYMTSKNSKGKAGHYYGGVHIATLESNPLDVVYSDPKDSKLYQVPGAEPVIKQPSSSASEDVLYKVYVSSGRESQYCRPYMTVRPPVTTQPTEMMSEYEEVNAADNNCVTMITVMPGTTRSTLTSSGSGTTEAGGSGATVGGLDLACITSSTRESETSGSSEGGSFIIDSAAFYENLYFHRIRSSMVRTTSTEFEDLSVGGPNWSKFGYSQKEVWNWLYTDHDINQNQPSFNRKTMTSKVASASSRHSKAVEVKFSLSEFIDCYKRLLGLNVEGFTEFVNRTLEAIVSTSMYVTSVQDKSMTQMRKTCCSSNQQTRKASLIMVPSLQRSVKLNSSSSQNNKTYVRLSMMKRPQEATALVAHPVASHHHQPGAISSCYQTLLDINNPKYHDAVIEDMIPYSSNLKNHLSIDLNLPLDRQEWYHGSITRHEAENALRLHEEGSFLVRNSESSSNDYSLSVKTTRGFMHMKIQERPGQGYILGQFSKPFHTIAQMLIYYSRNSLPVKGAEHISLKKPVCEQLL